MSPQVYEALFIALTLVMGGGLGVLARQFNPARQPMTLPWSIISGAVGALAIAGLGAWIGLFGLGDFMYFASAATGAVIGLLSYNIAIAKE